MIREIRGILTIDEERGVIYFHTTNKTEMKRYNSPLILRMCRLPKPIPSGRTLDVTHMYGCDWTGGNDGNKS